MVIVTDKQFYLDNSLKEMIDLFIKRQQKKWDNVLVIDGDERSGKSTLAKAIAYYYAHTTGKKFSLKNIFFDPEEMLEYATSKQEDIIVWDEAAFGGLSSQWQGKVQQKLNSMLMVSGKYRHFYIFIIPSFFRLNKYLALDRSLGLIHVYSPDMLTRGNFRCFSKRQKTWIYNSYKKTETYGKDHSFRGKFTLKNTDKIVDEKAYEAKKDDAIKRYLREVGDKTKLQLEELRFRVASQLPTAKAMEICQVSDQTIYNWKERGEFIGFEVKTKH